jgi:hypothetical protein
MFVRQLKHKNGKIYIQVVDKSSGQYKVIKSFGSATSHQAIITLFDKATIWLYSKTGMEELDFENGSTLSAQKVIEILQSIYQIDVLTPNTKQIIRKTLLLTDEHKSLNQLSDFGC